MEDFKRAATLILHSHKTTMILSFFNQNIKKYLNFDNNIYFPKTFTCPKCHNYSVFHRHGYYLRNIISFYFSGSINILRVKCTSCKSTHSVIPEFLFPKYQYSLSVILFSLFQIYINNRTTLNVALISKVPASRQSIFQFKKRFLLQKGILNMFFSSSIDNVLDNCSCESIVKAILQHQYAKRKFTIDFLANTSRYFMQKSN